MSESGIFRGTQYSLNTLRLFGSRDWSGLTVAGLEAIGQLQSVRYLEISHFKVPRRLDDACRVNLSKLRNLTKLHMLNTTISMEFIASLTSLKEVGLCGTRCEDLDIQFLPRLRYLTDLDLQACLITDAGLQLINRVHSLETLHIAFCPLLTDNGFRTLIGMPNLKKLHGARCCFDRNRQVSISQDTVNRLNQSNVLCVN